jgi:hypothetical protein
MAWSSVQISGLIQSLSAKIATFYRSVISFVASREAVALLSNFVRPSTNTYSAPARTSRND